MSKVKIVRDGIEISIYFEEDLWKKVNKSIFFNGLSVLYRATSIEKVEEIFREIEKKAAKAFAIRALGRRALFSSELRQKMYDKGLSSSAISEVLQFCERIGSIDDENLAKIKTEIELRKGKGQVAALLKIRRWVDVESISLDFPKIKELERESLLKYLQKKRIEVSSLKLDEQRKLYLTLLRRGFKKESIQEVFSGF